jgi:arylsulfatase A
VTHRLERRRLVSYGDEQEVTMPLLDHFAPPLSRTHPWRGFNSAWASAIARHLNNGGERLSDNGPLFHQKGTVWEGGIRVACVLRWPGRVAAGKVSQQPGISMDLTATILAACGLEPAKDRPLDGIDLLPVLKADKVIERTFYWRIDRDDRKQKAVRHGDWKYVKDGASEEAIELLFDLAKDQGEREDVSSANADTVKLLSDKLAAWEKEMAKHKPAHVVK